MQEQLVLFVLTELKDLNSIIQGMLISSGDTPPPQKTHTRTHNIMCMLSMGDILYTDMNGKIYGALVQFSCYQHRYEWKGLWCSSTVRLLSTQT